MESTFRCDFKYRNFKRGIKFPLQGIFIYEKQSLIQGRQKFALCWITGKMEGRKSAFDLHVTDLFGVQVLRKYVRTVGNNEQIYMREQTRFELCVFLLGATIVCTAVGLGIFYNPPAWVEEFGKSNTLALEEQLKNAKDRIGVLEREIERLKLEGLANITREKQILANLSTVEKENEDLSTRLSSANELIESLQLASSKNQSRLDDLEHNVEICMKEKTESQKKLSDLEKQENGVKHDLSECKANTEQLELHTEKSMLTKAVKAAEELSEEYEKNLGKCQEDHKSVLAQKETIGMKLMKTSNALTICQAKNERYQKSNADLTANMSTCQKKNENLEQDKDTLSKDLSAKKYTLGNCKNNNMDHEVRSLELLQEIEGLKKELKAC